MIPVFKRATVMACCLGLGALSTSAFGQGGAPGSSFGLGAAKIPDPGKTADRTEGLRFGRSVFHAGVALELGYDSNVFYSGQDAKGSVYLRLTPQLSLGTQKTGEDQLPFVTYMLSAGIDYIGYLQDISDNASRHQIGATVGAGAVFNPQGQLKFALTEQFTRTNEPRAGIDFGYNRDYNSLGFDLTWNPNKGFLTLLFAYRFILDFFEDPNDSTPGNELAAFNAMRHDVKLKVTWRFFPKTAFWGEISTGYNDYIEGFNSDPAVAGTPDAGNRSSAPFRALVGVTGQFTPFLVVDVGIGYRGLFYTDDMTGGLPGADMVHDVAAHVSATFDILQSAKLRFGYQHDTYDSIVGDYYKNDTVFLSAMASFFDRRLELKVGFAWSLVDYRDLYYADYADIPGDSCTVVSGNISSCKRKDNYLIVDFGATWYFKNWVSLGLGYQLLGNISDFEAVYTGTGTDTPIKPSFTKHRVFALVQVYY